MGMVLRKGEVNKIAKNTCIFRENEEINYVGLVVKGHIVLHNEGIKTMVASGSFLGLNDLYQGKYLFNYIAADDALVYVFEANSFEHIEEILSVKKEYAGFVIAYLSKIIQTMYESYTKLREQAEDGYDFIKKTIDQYMDMQQSVGDIPYQMDMIYQLQPYVSDKEYSEDEILFITESNSIPVDVMKAYYSYSMILATQTIEKYAGYVSDLSLELKALAKYNVSLMNCLYSKSSENIMHILAQTIGKMDIRNHYKGAMMVIMDEVNDEVLELEKIIQTSTGTMVTLDHEGLKEVYSFIFSNKNSSLSPGSNVSKKSDEEIEQLLKNSLSQILAYSRVDNDIQAAFRENVEQFLQLKDKFVVDDESRKLRKSIAFYFYQIYEAVFLRAYEEKNYPRVIDMFLDYGFMDERLLNQKQLVQLYHLQGKEEEKLCSVYTIREWLTLIYEGKKEPSKSEFDLDYKDMVRQMSKRKEITPKEEQEYYTNQEKKLNYEIINMFQYNMRLTNGKISTFVPILFEDMLTNDLESSLVTPARVNEAMKRILLVDYSAFYREELYINEKAGITKDYIMKEYLPDIILLPTMGPNGVMWQEITNKKRSSEGRFLLPILKEGKLYDMLVSVVGKFRWELCRTLQGSGWNDIKQKSLTSEYSDYIQFFRKNRDLSEEKKEKIKTQLQKARNSSREFFAIDYELWIKYESMGSMRLNKVAREILATYCPFAKKTRDVLDGRPVYDQAMVRYYRHNVKKQREYDAKIIAIQKGRHEVPEEILRTKIYYSEL